MKRKELEKKLKGIEEKRAQCITGMINTLEMIRGSYHETYTKCGRQGCECETGKGHPCQRITWREKTKPRTKGVPDDQKEWAKLMTESYKKFRKYRKGIKDTDVLINHVLNELEAIIVEETWKKNKKFTL